MVMFTHRPLLELLHRRLDAGRIRGKHDELFNVTEAKGRTSSMNFVTL